MARNGSLITLISNTNRFSHTELILQRNIFLQEQLHWSRAELIETLLIDRFTLPPGYAIQYVEEGVINWRKAMKNLPNDSVTSTNRVLARRQVMLEPFRCHRAIRANVLPNDAGTALQPGNNSGGAIYCINGLVECTLRQWTIHNCRPPKVTWRNR